MMKSVMKRCLFPLALLIALLLLLNGCEGEYRRTVFCVDTPITLFAYGKNATEAVDKAVARLQEIEREMSAYREDSVIAQINRDAGLKPVSVSQPLYDLIALAISYSEKTDGLFDITSKPLKDLWQFDADSPTLPAEADLKAALPLVDYRKVLLDAANRTVFLTSPHMQLDLRAIVKGYAADEVCRIYNSCNLSYGGGNLGGNILAYRRLPRTVTLWGRTLALSFLPARDWRVGIQDPLQPAGLSALSVTTENSGVSTSGAYQRGFWLEGKRYHHLLDAHTGQPVQNGITSVSVLSDNAALADLLSTAIYLCGTEKGLALAQQAGVTAVILDSEKRVYSNAEHTRLQLLGEGYKFFEMSDSASDASVS